MFGCIAQCLHYLQYPKFNQGFFVTTTTVNYISNNLLSQPVVNNEKLAKAMQQWASEGRATMKLRLINWARWIRRDSKSVIDGDTGQIKKSPSYRLIKQAPFSEKSGYVYEAAEPIDEEDAIRVNDLLCQLGDNDLILVHAIYEHGINFKDIARFNKCSIRTIERWHAAALDKLFDFATC
jgi:DNA-directed RNA polymerase specialized sigma24 family protein